MLTFYTEQFLKAKKISSCFYKQKETGIPLKGISLQSIYWVKNLFAFV